jgi:hypothetical protein
VETLTDARAERNTLPSPFRLIHRKYSLRAIIVLTAADQARSVSSAIAFEEELPMAIPIWQLAESMTPMGIKTLGMSCVLHNLWYMCQYKMTDI